VLVFFCGNQVSHRHGKLDGSGFIEDWYSKDSKFKWIRPDKSPKKCVMPDDLPTRKPGEFTAE
jgi:hypothetical protein